MVAPIYSDRKGIYKDLYREIDADNKRKGLEKDASQARKPRKGIYVNLYRQLKEDNKTINFKKDKAEQGKEERFENKYFSNLLFYSSKIETAINLVIATLYSKFKLVMSMMG